MTARIYAIVFALGIFVPFFVWAEDIPSSEVKVSETAKTAQESGVSVVEDGEAFPKEGEGATEQEPAVPVRGSLPQLIQDKWDEIFQAIQQDNLKAVNDRVLELDLLKIGAGFESLEDYSFELIAQGTHKARLHEMDSAYVYLEMAQFLSPYSSRVLVKSLPLVQVTSGTKAMLSQLGKAVKWIWYYPEILVNFLWGLIYPLLWALTLGLYTATSLYLLYNMRDVIASIARHFPTMIRGFVSPVLAVGVLCAPVVFGPIASVAVWGLVIFILLPERRWLGFLAGAVLLLWAGLIPVRENIGLWLADDGVQTMLRVSSGAHSRADREVLEALTNKRENDGVVYYTYGQLLRKYEEYDKSERMFERAEKLLGKQPWTVSQRGTIAFLKGEFERADRLFGKAQKMGYDSPEFLLNYSKIKFELMDTAASRELYKNANRKNSDLAGLLRKREKIVGIRGNSAIAEMQLPNRVIFQSALIPLTGVRPITSRITAALVKKSTPMQLGLMGLVLIVLFFLLPTNKPRKKIGSYYQQYTPSGVLLFFIHIIPGGSWVVRGRPVWTFIATSVCFLLLMPIVRWPHPDSAFLQALLPGLGSLYVMGVVLLMLGVSYVAYHTSEGS